ncbi:PH domain-containing protein [Deinococcus aquiradiocola]|nr:PH domain-containing protein [Deinococcus aquiradiocola]
MTAPTDLVRVPVAPAFTRRATWPLLRALGAALLVLLGVLLVVPPLLGYPRYEVRGGTLTVRSLATHRILPASTPAQRVTLPPLTRAMGTRAVGRDGTGTCVGRFRDASGQRYELYTDCSADALVFRVPGRPLLAVTPDDPAAFLAALQNGGTGTFGTPRHGVPPGSWLGALPLFVLAALLLWPWPPLQYRLTPDALEVRRRLGVDRLPYAGLSVRPARSRLGVRLVGTGLPGYHTGLYATADGQVMAVATSTRAPGLLLTSGHATYYLTPADPHALTAELRARGATLLNE